ncbi:hypothetical protein C7Y72_01990 [Paraconexibacter algicola]|uniref:Htaa domain-containing protein n=2 Tax=Paraconexibacter algicola TaxID=2133960 RepID=A0A2T4UGZ3_9ACTN|nr:hypothetical protein C7Y72_01990 [Paraconexibacter algicola]
MLGCPDMRLLIGLTTVGVLGCAATATAAPAPVTGGALEWTQANVYETGAPDGTNRTWLGYTTALGPPFTNGTARPTAPATGPTVTAQSARGADATATTSFPVAAGGSWDATTGEGTLEFAGTLSFTSAAHGFTITVSNPRVVVAAGRAQLFASGSGSSGSGQSSSAGATYDRSRPVFDLALPPVSTEGTVTTIAGAAPAIATADMVWPGGSYPAGAGPDRTPNTFGRFTVRVDTAAAAAPVAAPTPPAVVQPVAPVATTPGTTTAPARLGTPRIRCARTRRGGAPRTTCTITTATTVRRVAVTFQGRRVGRAAVRGGVARVELPRKRRRLAFVLQDARGRELGRRTLTVGG